MYSWMEKIYMPDSMGYIDENGEPLIALGGLKRVNFFVGSTGSGKSRLLRYLSSMENPEVEIGGAVSSELAPKLTEFLPLLDKAIHDAEAYALHWRNQKYPGHADFLLTSLNTIRRCCAVKSNVKDDPTGGVLSAASSLSNIKRYFLSNLESAIKNTSHKDDYPPLSINQAFDQLNSLVEEYGDSQEYGMTAYMHAKCRVFIPSLRYIEYPQNTDEEIHGQIEGLIADRYFSSLPDGLSVPNIWSGGKLTKRLKNWFDEGSSKIEGFREFEQYLADEVLGASQVRIKIDEAESQILINVDGTERPIYEYGDGLSHLIILTFLSYLQGLGVFFIDEPEVGLHPGLQQAFMKALKPLRTEICQQYFIVTHSNHFLDQAIIDEDIAIFRFKAIENGMCQVQQIEWGDRPLLNDLGVRPSASFMVNATIWVEGITDRLFFSHLIKLALQESKGSLNLIEGVHFSFVEYGGANLPHWSFLEQEEDQIDVDTLCGDSVLIIDADSAKWKDKRQRRLRQRLGARLFVTCGRELENMVSGKMLDEFARHRKYSDSKRASRKDFKNVPLGQYMEDFYSISGLKAESGTLKTPHKKSLLKVVTNTEKLSKFPREVQSIASRLLTFIESKNS